LLGMIHRHNDQREATIEIDSNIAFAIARLLVCHLRSIDQCESSLVVAVRGDFSRKDPKKEAGSQS